MKLKWMSPDTYEKHGSKIVVAEIKKNIYGICSILATRTEKNALQYELHNLESEIAKLSPEAQKKNNCQWISMVTTDTESECADWDE